MNTHKRKHMRRHNRTVRKGGQVIASGGYGCVFSPALVCKDSSSSLTTRGKRGRNKISKLMSEKHAKEEYELIQAIQQKLDSIPNYKDYFLIYNVSMCSPASLSKSDMTHFNKCKSLKKDNITKQNINQNLDRVMALNLPHGGLPVDDFIYKDGNYTKLYKTHNALVDLLKHGIIPMNEKRVYHSDIKDSNILMDTDFKARLIDWGLSVEYKELDPFPKNWKNRPLQFNVPFSVILFTDSFYEKYSSYLTNGGKVEEHDLKIFVLDYLAFWNKERGSGHYKFINEILYLLYHQQFQHISESQKPNMVEVEITIPYIINYLTTVLLHYTKFKKDGTLNLREYVNEVYIYIVDIWGFLMCYFPMLEVCCNNNNTEIVDQLRLLFYTYLYEPRFKPIDMKSLYHELHVLGELIQHMTTHTSDNRTDLNGGKRVFSFIRPKLVKHFNRPFLLSLTK